MSEAVQHDAVIITGPTRGLGLAAALYVARASPRTALLLLGAPYVWTPEEGRAPLGLASLLLLWLLLLLLLLLL